MKIFIPVRPSRKNSSEDDEENYDDW